LNFGYHNVFERKFDQSAMHIRFVVGDVDPDSGVEAGILQTLNDLLEYDDPCPYPRRTS
jgi:hypothetical protein